jgi:dolichyl-phosphate beta-glucosyltransferase
MDTYFLSVVVPAYNEERRLGRTLDSVIDHLKNCPWNSEIIVVDDGSTDHTAEVARGYEQVKLLLNQRNVGKGEAVRRGVLAASGQFVLMMDADHATPISELHKFVPRAAASDIIIASRHLETSKFLKHPSLFRRANSWLFRKATRKLVGLYLSDTQCGFKMFNGRVVEQLFSRPFLGRFSFDVELLLRAKKGGLSIDEVGIQWEHRPRTKVRLWHIIGMYLDLWAIRQRYHTKKAQQGPIGNLED